MKKHVRTTERLHDHVRGGLPYTALLALAERLELPIGTLGLVLNISPRTLARRRRSRRLSPDESDRLARAARIVAMAEDVLGARVKAARWITEPNWALGGVVPLQRLGTDVGARDVETVLIRFEHGVYS